MPTYFMIDNYNGDTETFEDFAMKCSRHFVLHNETPRETPIPDKFEASNFHAQELEYGIAKVARIMAWDETGADRLAQLDYTRAQNDYEEELARRAAMLERYEAMLAQVKAWTPPTPEHQELKNFMLNQVVESISDDCRTTYLTAPQRITGAAYKEERLEHALRNVRFYTKEVEEGKKRAEERTNWVNALRESLGVSSRASVEA